MADRQRQGKGFKAHLTLQELEAQYPFSTKDAARNLGVSRTTLKRACRWARGGWLMMIWAAITDGERRH